MITKAFRGQEPNPMDLFSNVLRIFELTDYLVRLEIWTLTSFTEHCTWGTLYQGKSRSENYLTEGAKKLSLTANYCFCKMQD